MALKRPRLHDDPGGRTAVYRFYADTGQLLYVGISECLGRRWATHAARKTWWPDVAVKTVVWHGTRLGAACEESSAIHSEGPRHNATPYGDVKVGWEYSLETRGAGKPRRHAPLDLLRTAQASAERIAVGHAAPHFAAVIRKRATSLGGQRTRIYTVTNLPGVGVVPLPLPGIWDREAWNEEDVVREHYFELAALAARRAGEKVTLSMHYGDWVAAA